MKSMIFLLLAVIVAGCTTKNCPELVTYREGLHSLDASLYAEHKQLMSDAVAKGIRTQSDSNVVQLQISQAEAHYQSSRAGDASATKP